MKIIVSVNSKIESLNLVEGSEFVLGRETSPIEIKQTEVSREHLKLKLERGQFLFCDVSSNGSYLNGKKLAKNQWHVLGKTQIVQLTHDGSVFIQVSEQPKSENTNTLSLNKWLTRKNVVTIGRSNDCDIVLSDQQISRKHATIESRGNSYFVDDHSLNGTFINGKRLTKRTLLNPDDIITIGLYQFSINQAVQHFNKELAIRVRDVSFSFSNGTIGIHPVSFSIEKEKMVALMGPSGCGKSTLLQLLNGVYKPASGDVEVFGLSLRQNFELLKQFIGYVPQENIVHEDLTINQALYYTAKLRLGQNVNVDELNERINHVLDNLNINEPALRTQALKTLSGGQKKRVSIAVELLTQPKILFLDEPTSPLDPETIEEFLKSLQNLCSLGTTVVLVTHKPEDLAFMDEVIFMGKGGHLVYYGNKSDITSHFACERLPQVYNKLSTRNEAKHFYEIFRKNNKLSNGSKAPRLADDQNNSINYAFQFWWLVMRYAQLKLNNKENLLIAFSQPIIVALLTYLVFPYLTNENEEGLVSGNIGVLFITALTVIWFGISNSAKEIVSEKAIFNREHLFNLATLPYLLSKVAVLFLLTFAQTFVFLTLIKLSFPELQDFSLQFLYLGILGLSAVTFGLALSAWSKSTEAVMTMLPVVLIPQIVLAGIIHPLENKTTELLSFLSLGRWGTEGVGRIQDRIFSTDSAPFLSILEQNLYQNQADLKVASITGNAYVLLILALLFTVLTFVKLKKDHG